MGIGSTGHRDGAGAAEVGRRCRLPAAVLPDGLTHGPSRRFLTEEGLPGKAADLDFAALRAGRLEAFTKWEGGEVVGDGRLLVLGETEYCGSKVVLDGVSGEVHLAAWTGGELRRDLLASGLRALAGLIRETESPSALAVDPYGGRRGAAVAAEVVEAAERRMRTVDPRLFAADPSPAHWGTALLVRSLRWGARPGGPGGLAYEFGPDLVEELALLSDESAVHRYRPGELPPGLTHEPTRRLLTEVGLPLGGEMFAVSDEPLRTMAVAHPGTYGEADGRNGPDAAGGRAYQHDYIAIGWWPHDLTVALDGATGRLELPAWYGEGEPRAYLNRDLSALLYACWTYERLRHEWQRWEDGSSDESWQVFDPQTLLLSHVDAMVETVDPEAFETPRHSWRMLAEDPHTGGLLA